MYQKYLFSISNNHLKLCSPSTTKLQKLSLFTNITMLSRAASTSSFQLRSPLFFTFRSNQLLKTQSKQYGARSINIISSYKQIFLNVESKPFLPTSTFTTATSSNFFSTSTSSCSSNSSSIINNKDQQHQMLNPLVVCGPSGVGKGTIIEKYMEEYGGSQKFGFTVSHTTRKPRPGEENGVHYHFTELDTMKDAIEKNEFLEYAEVHGNYYGTSLTSLQSVVEESGKLPLLDIDVQGVKNIKTYEENQLQNENKDHDENGENISSPRLETKFIFIAPPSLDLLLQRLISRGTETEDSIKRRTNNAASEVEYGLKEGNFDAIVVNDDLNKACIDFANAIEKIYRQE
mmetsp:Transcript_10790/g.12497  ORF Transcript_10790/g.12497 Transcript_10790/m.12497 type:complete len:345 (-) Transcript_10790:3213-4247(-)